MEIKKKEKFSLTSKIFIALFSGMILGMVLHYFVPEGYIRDQVLVEGVFYIIGQIFIRLMQMLVVPLVFFSIADGCRNMGDSKTLGKVGGRILIFYLTTTAIAIIVALVIAKLINPGQGMQMSLGDNTYKVEGADSVSFKDTILDMIPKNPIASLANGNMLQIIIFSVFIGLLVSNLEERVETLGNIITEMNDLMMAMTMAVMKVAPIGVFFLIARTFASLGYDVILSMLSYMLSVILGLAFQLLIVYMLFLMVFLRVNPYAFLKKYLPVLTFAFSTASYAATVPVSLKTLDDLGVDKKVSSFTIPLGATVNMDGTAIMQGVAVVFIANAYGIDLNMNDYMTVILTATIASVGTAAIPSVGLVTLSMVLTSVGLPVEGIAMIMGIDRILDMARTAVNATGDGVGSIIVANSVNLLNREKFNRKI